MNYRLADLTFALALVSVSSPELAAQQDHLVRQVAHPGTVVLKGNTNPNANPQFDAGPVDPSLRLDHLVLMLQRSDAQQAALDQLLADQQNWASHLYHAWLTPETFADHFGLGAGDISRVASWLRSEGLVVDEISRGRSWIRFSGTVERVQGALQTELRRYRVNGESHFANATAPSVPATIAPFVIGVLGLDDFHPTAARSPAAMSNSQVGKTVPSPQFSSSTGSHNLAPDDFATIYNVAPFYNLGYDGTGQRIAVVGQSAVDLADIQAFRSLYGLPKNDPQLVLVPGFSDPGKNSFMEKADLDIEWAGAVARNANIIYVYSTDVFRLSLIYAIDQNIAPIIVYTFGQCEQSQSDSTVSSMRLLAQQANAQGITMLASAGDSGAAGCEPPSIPPSAKALHGATIQLPAGLPEVTAVGGTQFDDAVGNYWSASNSPTSGSALSYIPEKGWNESDANGLASTGGGFSGVFPRPSWQVGPGVPTSNFRAVPDVSLAAASHDGYLEVTGGQPSVGRGTSAATASFAGILALVNQYQELNGVPTQSGQGNINPNLYSLAQNTAGVFHDITSGNNIVSCTTGTPDCSSGTLGYTAGPGYDLVSGLGSVDAFNLAVNLARQWSTPVIALLNPSSVIAGGGTFTLAVNGTGFDSASVVQWTGTPLPTKFVSNTQLLATVDRTLIVSLGSIPVTVQTTHGTTAAVSIVLRTSFGAVIGDVRVTTKPPPPSGCVFPPAQTSFSIADTVYLYFLGTVNTNDVLTYDWVNPYGVTTLGGSWPTVSGLFCFPTVSLPLPRVGFNPVGAWQVRVFDHGSLVFSLSFSVTAPGYQTIPLAHAADGGGFKTTVLLTNASTADAPYTLRFNDDHGNIPATRFELETGSLAGIIPAGESVTIRTAGLGSQVVGGWAELTAPPSVAGSVIYSQKTGLPSIQEGTSTIVTSGSKHFFVPFDNTSGAITGLALTDPGPAGASNISITFRYSDGTSEVISYPQLASRNHQAFALPSQFPHTAKRSGVAEFTSDAALSVAVFRFNSTGAFTAFDATPAGVSGPPINRPLAHAADGGGFKTTVLLTNAGTVDAPYTLRFNDDRGNIPTTRFELEAGSLTGVIPVGGSVTIRTAGLGLQVVGGWAELTAPAAVGGSVIYSQITGLPSIQEGTATIVTSGSTDFFLPFDNTSGAITGLALTDPGATGARTILALFRYTDGTSDLILCPPIASRDHQAFALADRFPNTANRSGVVEFASDAALSAVVFRFNSTGAFTSFGIVVP